MSREMLALHVAQSLQNSCSVDSHQLSLSGASSWSSNAKHLQAYKQRPAILWINFTKDLSFRDHCSNMQLLMQLPNNNVQALIAPTYTASHKNVPLYFGLYRTCFLMNFHNSFSY